MLSAKCAPMAERSTLGDQANAQRSESITCPAPAAAALRSSVPTLPGSWMSSSSRTSGAVAGTLFAPGVFTQAMTPVGLSTVESASKSASARRISRAGAARSMSRAIGLCSSAVRLRTIDSGRAPESRRASSRCSPSMSERPCRRRSALLVESFASALKAALSRELIVFMAALERQVGLELRVHRLEAAPMDLAGAEGVQRREMRGRAVTLVLRESVRGEVPVEVHHVRVASRLRKDRGRGDGRDQAVAADDGAAGKPHVGHVEPVHAHFTRGKGQQLERATHGEQGRAQDVDAVDLLHARGGDGPGERAIADAPGEAPALLGIEQLGIREALDRPGRVE